jgi:hypothetical protein
MAALKFERDIITSSAASLNERVVLPVIKLEELESK